MKKPDNRGHNYVHVYRTAGLQVPYLLGKIAKLGGVVIFVDTHPSTHTQSVPVKIDWRQQQEETSALLKTGDQCTP